MKIRVENIKKKFRKYLALDDVSITIQPGEFLALLGPSGSGKTTLLRIIAGLENEDSGAVYLDGLSEADSKKGSVGFVFQHYALFRHMTVFENVAFGLRVRPYRVRKTEKEIRERVRELLSLVHLSGLEWQYPSQLSGGQRQRVALARVLAIEPKVMLLDEPFGALDSKVRKELRRWLRRLHDDMGITTIFVTHDQEEAMEIADRVAILDKGKIVQVGTPEEIWSHPANAFVYDFLGHYNEFLGWQDEVGVLHLCDDEILLKMIHERNQNGDEDEYKQSWWKKFLSYLGFPSSRNQKIAPSVSEYPERNYVPVFIRPFEIRIDKEPLEETSAVPAKVVHVNPAGSLIKVELERATGQLIQAEVSKEVAEMLEIKRGDVLWISPKNYKIFTPE